MHGSRIAGFHRLERAERLRTLGEAAGLDAGEVTALADPVALPHEMAEHMIENAVSVIGLPLGVALNFVINGRERLVPMAIEEPSVVAAASHAARLVRNAGGFFAEATAPLMIAQIQLVDVPDLAAAGQQIQAATLPLLAAANAVHPNLLRRGAGARRIDVRPLPETPCGPMLVVHLVVDVGDAMGANAVNAMAEALSPPIEKLTGGTARLRILSNLADQRLARARVRIPFACLETPALRGDEVAARMEQAWAFAAADPYRAATHNKGVMNGIDAVAIAAGQDWRGIEAGAHPYAARHGHYGPLSERVGRGRAPGKVILLGEHAVVYGHTAIAGSIDRHVAVRVRARHPASAQRRRIGLDARTAAAPRPTRAVVAALRQRRARDGARHQALFAGIDALVGEAEPAIAAGQLDLLGRLMQCNHELLRALGVSTAELDAMVDVAAAHGALGAKLTGGGGGGAIICLPGDDPRRLIDAFAAAGWPAFIATIAPRGLESHAPDDRHAPPCGAALS
jgi:hydroxymethylglutaryl-CoA reductase